MKFTDKWGIDPYYFIDIRKDITSLIEEAKNNKMNIMHIGCGAGGTLLDIKNKLSEVNLYGIEENKDVVMNTEHFCEINIGDIDNIKKYKEKFFDYIIISHREKSISDLRQIIIKMKEYIKDTGNIILILIKRFDNENDIKKSKLEKIFNKFSYSFYECEYDKLLSIQSMDND